MARVGAREEDAVCARVRVSEGGHHHSVWMLHVWCVWACALLHKQCVRRFVPVRVRKPRGRGGVRVRFNTCVCLCVPGKAWWDVALLNMHIRKAEGASVAHAICLWQGVSTKHMLPASALACHVPCAFMTAHICMRLSRPWCAHAFTHARTHTCMRTRAHTHTHASMGLFLHVRGSAKTCTHCAP